MTPHPASRMFLLRRQPIALRDVFQWPALHRQAGEVSGRARIMIEASEAAVSVREAAGQNHLFQAGTQLGAVRVAESRFTKYGAAAPFLPLRVAQQMGDLARRDDQQKPQQVVAVFQLRKAVVLHSREEAIEGAQDHIFLVRHAAG